MKNKLKTSQGFLDIEKVYSGVVILKDKSMRMILMASSINFDLKSVEEQTAILLQFQNFLNSLEFSTQFYIQSRRMDIRPYLDKLKTRLEINMSELMRVQTEEYIDFVRNFTKITDIMTKSFFVVIPYSGRLAKIPNEQTTKKTSTDRFKEGKTQLEQRANIVKQGLIRTGVKVVILESEEVIELYYNVFNQSNSSDK